MSRAAFPHSEKEIAALSLDQLNGQISLYAQRLDFAGSGAGAKALFKHLVWLEKQREMLHGIPAKQRRFKR